MYQSVSKCEWGSGLAGNIMEPSLKTDLADILGRYLNGAIIIYILLADLVYLNYYFGLITPSSNLVVSVQPVSSTL